MYRLRLKEILAERGLTQRDLEAMTGVQQSTISGWYRNDVTRVDLGLLHKFCKALNVSVEEIIVEDDAAEGQSEAAA